MKKNLRCIISLWSPCGTGRQNFKTIIKSWEVPAKKTLNFPSMINKHRCKDVEGKTIALTNRSQFWVKISHPLKNFFYILFTSYLEYFKAFEGLNVIANWMKRKFRFIWALKLHSKEFKSCHQWMDCNVGSLALPFRKIS